MTVRFDDSLNVAAEFILKNFGEEALYSSLTVRDASGRLSVLLKQEVDANDLTVASQALQKELGGYGRDGATLRDLASPGVKVLFEEARRIRRAAVGGHLIKLLDRRVIGADWLEEPSEHSKGKIPRIVFASLKGGVGRSTALSVACAHFSSIGKRVLAIDLDLEAPGIGSILLREDETPDFGVLDYLVENNLSGVDQLFLEQCTGDSSLGGLGGRVAVMPALGARTLANPSNALAKLARAYLEDVSENGQTLNFSAQISQMIASHEASGKFDVVLIDARSGLHESNAAVIQNIDATVLLFASDQPQTYAGYRILLTHLANAASTNPDWLDRFQFVNAKAADDEIGHGRVQERLTTMVTALTAQPRQSEPQIQNLTATDFDLDWTTEEEISATALEEELSDVVSVVPVLFDPRFDSFDPLSRSDLLTPGVYGSAFGMMLDFLDTLVPDQIEDERHG